MRVSGAQVDRASQCPWGQGVWSSGSLELPLWGQWLLSVFGGDSGGPGAQDAGCLAVLVHGNERFSPKGQGALLVNKHIVLRALTRAVPAPSPGRGSCLPAVLRLWRASVPCAVWEAVLRQESPCADPLPPGPVVPSLSGRSSSGD